MIRQNVINGDPMLLYQFLKLYEGILYNDVTITPFADGIYTFSASLLNDPSTDSFSIYMNTVEGYEQIRVGSETLKSETASSGATLVNQLDYAYGTDNGFMLHFTYDAINGVPNLFTTILISKGSDDNPFIVLSNPGTAPTDNDLTHLTAKIFHYGDVNPLEFTMCQFDTAMQTLAVPFAGYGNVANVTHAPHAHWFPVSDFYGQGFNRMSFGDVECITNGYWMVDDKPDEEVDE